MGGRRAVSLSELKRGAVLRGSGREEVKIHTALGGWSCGGGKGFRCAADI